MNNVISTNFLLLLVLGLKKKSRAGGLAQQGRSFHCVKSKPNQGWPLPTSGCRHSSDWHFSEAVAPPSASRPDWSPPRSTTSLPPLTRGSESLLTWMWQFGARFNPQVGLLKKQMGVAWGPEDSEGGADSWRCCPLRAG